MSTHFDCLIIGGGPGGLTAALTLARQRHTAVVFDSGEYHNDGTAYMHTVPTWDHKSPADWRAAARKNTLNNYQSVTFVDTAAESVKKNDSGSTKAQTCFEVTTSKGETFYGAKLVLASGCKDVYPEIPGFAEAWPTGIFHCLFCHGYEERDSPSSGILAVGTTAAAAGALHFARNALQLTKSVTIYTDGAVDVANEITSLLGEAKDRMKSDARKIARIEKLDQGASVALHFDDGSSATEAFLQHMPAAIPRGNFIEQLGLETDMGNVVVKGMFNETSVRGVFAVGDIMAHQKIFNHAVWTGCAAGAGIAVQLQADNLGHKPLVGH